MPTTPLLHRIAGACFTALAATPLMAAVPAAQDPLPREFHLAAQTSRDSIWAEHCGTERRSHGGPAALRVTPVAWAQPQPDPTALAALGSALRRGDFETSGVRVVETDGGPMLTVAGTHPGARDNHFKLCNVSVHTSYD